MILLFFWIISAAIIGAVGSSRTIGFLLSFIASLFLSPLIGLIIVLASERKSDRKYKEKMLRYMKVSNNIDPEKLNALNETFQQNTAREISKNKRAINVVNILICSAVLLIILIVAIKYFSN